MLLEAEDAGEAVVEEAEEVEEVEEEATDLRGISTTIPHQNTHTRVEMTDQGTKTTMIGTPRAAEAVEEAEEEVEDEAEEEAAEAEAASLDRSSMRRSLLRIRPAQELRTGFLDSNNNKVMYEFAGQLLDSVSLSEWLRR